MRAAFLSGIVVIAALSGCADRDGKQTLDAHPGALLTIPVKDPDGVDFVKFSGNAVDVVEAPLWTEAGAVVVAVPFYLNPATNRPAPGTFDVSVTMDGNTYEKVVQIKVVQPQPSSSLPPGAAAAAGYRLLALSAMHQASELAYFQAAVEPPGNGGEGAALADDLAALSKLAQDATRMAKALERENSSFPAEALPDMDLALGLWLSAASSASTFRTQKEETGPRVYLFSSTLDLAALETVRTTYSDVRTTQELTKFEEGGVLQKMIAATKALTGWAERFDVETPSGFVPAAGIATGQTAAATATKSFLDSFFGELQQAITATVTGADFEPTPVEVHARGLVDGFMDSGAEVLSFARGVPAGDSYSAFKDGLAVVESGLDLVRGGARADVATSLGGRTHDLGGGWITGRIDGDRTASGLEPVLVTAASGDKALRAFTGKDGAYAIPAPAIVGRDGIGDTIRASDVVSGADVTGETTVDLSGLAADADVQVPAIPEVAPEPDEYGSDMAGAWGSVSGYEGCTWNLSYDGTVRIVLPPDPSDGGSVYVDLTAYWKGGTCDPWTGHGAASGNIGMRTTNLFKATLDGFVDEHPMVVTVEGNTAGSTPWGTAKIEVTWEPQVTPQTTTSTASLQFARR